MLQHAGPTILEWNSWPAAGPENNLQQVALSKQQAGLKPQQVLLNINEAKLEALQHATCSLASR